MRVRGRTALATAVAGCWGFLGFVAGVASELPPPAEGTAALTAGLVAAALLAWCLDAFDRSHR